MKKLLLLIATYNCVAFMTASAIIINIPDDYATIQEGIDASTDDDIVLVQPYPHDPGAYVENINLNGHNIVLGSLFLTTGDTTFISQTVIDGGLFGPVVTFESGENSATVITGFTIQNGNSQTGGGGIFCQNSNPTVANNIIRQNVAEGTWGMKAIGGGIYCDNCSPTIINNRISDNSTWGPWGVSGYGGGIGCSDSNPTIVGNFISGNLTYGEWGFGGGICLLASSPMIDDNVITANFAYHFGGGIYCYDGSNPIMTNNAISGNEACDYLGGGICCVLESDPLVINTIFWANIGLEIYIDESSSPCFTYCDIEGGWDGEGNIDASPLFRDPQNGDFHLMSTQCGDLYDSPCIDVGHPDIRDSFLDCSRGLGEWRSDIGAYGGGAEASDCNYIPGDCDNNGTPLELGDVIAMIGAYRGTIPNIYRCSCPPNGDDFPVTADPNGNCVPYELNDVMTELAAYRGLAEVSGCPDCPGSE